MKSTTVYVLLFLISTTILNAQSLNEQLASSQERVYEAVEGFNNMDNNAEQTISLNELERQIRVFILTDSTVTNAEINREVSNVPAILWGLGGVASYVGLNFVLYGGMDNAGYPGMVLSAAGALVIGAIVNAGRRDKARRRILARKMKR